MATKDAPNPHDVELPEDEQETTAAPPAAPVADDPTYKAKKWHGPVDEIIGEAPIVLETMRGFGVLTIADLHRWVTQIGVENARAHLRGAMPDNNVAIERVFTRLTSWCLDNNAVPPNMS